MKNFREGQRVRVKSLNIKGTIFYVDQPDYFNHHFHPIQVTLDKPYDDLGQTMYRTNIRDIVKLKPKKKVDDDVFFDFSE